MNRLFQGKNNLHNRYNIYFHLCEGEKGEGTPVSGGNSLNYKSKDKKFNFKTAKDSSGNYHTVKEACFHASNIHSFILPLSGFTFTPKVQHITKKCDLFSFQENTQFTDFYLCCLPIAALHSYDIGHKDIKQGNYLTDNKLRYMIYLIDFGSANNAQTQIGHTQPYSILPDGYTHYLAKIPQVLYDQYSLLFILKENQNKINSKYQNTKIPIFNEKENVIIKQILKKRKEFISEPDLKEEEILKKVLQPCITVNALINTIEKRSKALPSDFFTSVQKYNLKACDNVTISTALTKGAYLDTYPSALFKNSIERLDENATSGLASFFEEGKSPSQDFFKIYPYTRKSLKQNYRLAYKLYKRAAKLGCEMSRIKISLAQSEVLETYDSISNNTAIISDLDLIRLGQICEGIGDHDVRDPPDLTDCDLQTEVNNLLNKKSFVDDDDNWDQLSFLYEKLAMEFYSLVGGPYKTLADYYTKMHQFRRLIRYNDNKGINDIVEQLKQLNYDYCNVQLAWYYQYLANSPNEAEKLIKDNNSDEAQNFRKFKKVIDKNDEITFDMFEVLLVEAFEAQIPSF